MVIPSLTILRRLTLVGFSNKSEYNIRLDEILDSMRLELSHSFAIQQEMEMAELEKRGSDLFTDELLNSSSKSKKRESPPSVILKQSTPKIKKFQTLRSEKEANVAKKKYFEYF